MEKVNKAPEKSLQNKKGQIQKASQQRCDFCCELDYTSTQEWLKQSKPNHLGKISFEVDILANSKQIEGHSEDFRPDSY